MKFVVIFGPPAVGKMTVGHELAKITGLKLFHNHMPIDLVLNFFDFREAPFFRLVSEFRRRVLEEVAASELPRLILLSYRRWNWHLNGSLSKIPVRSFERKAPRCFLSNSRRINASD